MRYHCDKCDIAATTKTDLREHIENRMKECDIPVINVSTLQIQKGYFQ